MAALKLACYLLLQNCMQLFATLLSYICRLAIPYRKIKTHAVAPKIQKSGNFEALSRRVSATWVQFACIKYFNKKSGRNSKKDPKTQY